MNEGNWAARRRVASLFVGPHATDEPLGQLLATSARWRIVYSDQEFLIAQPRDDSTP